ncbi:hypothetical protein ACFOZ7_16825 [Natribaculum luteum]|uniref:Uncharacterized protein n=1 Tax=Natribaculum luteum TaxID=1586232 RepID=A0ABD5P2N8_9EURY|nr:hypothetical protein [Natribaculum luteum]
MAVVSPNDSTARRDGQEPLNVAPVRLTGVGSTTIELLARATVPVVVSFPEP